MPYNQLDKKSLLIGIVLAVVFLGLPRFFNLLLSLTYDRTTTWIFVSYLALIGSICVLTTTLYFFIKEYVKNKSALDAFRKSFYKVRIVLFIYLTCLVFDLIFSFLSILFLHSLTMYQVNVMILLSFVISLFLVSVFYILFHLLLQKKMKSIENDLDKIDEQTEKIIKEAEKDFKN